MGDSPHWADADVAQAADYMRRLVEDEDYRKRIGEKAQAFMDENHSFRHVGDHYLRRLKLIGLLPDTEESVKLENRRQK